MPALRPSSCAWSGILLALALTARSMSADTAPKPAVGAAVDAAVDAAAKAITGEQEAAADSPQEKVKDVVKDTIKGAIDGTLKETVKETIKDALTDSPKDGPGDGPQQTKIVLRFSREFIRRHSPPPVEHVAPIDRCLFGSHVTGTSVTRGRPAVDLNTDQSRPTFTLHFKGTVTTRTVATRHPVKAYNTGNAVFDVHRQISFDGLAFSEGPESIEASYSSRLDRLSTPPGLRGCIVRRFAMPQIEKTKPKADAIALRETRASVLEAFGKHTDKLVNDLNANVPWKQTLALLLPQQTAWSGHVSSTKEWVLVSPGPKDAKVPDLPDEADSMKAPIELWVHGKPDAATAAKVVALWSAVHTAMDRFRETSSSKAHDVVETFKPTTVGEWWVIHVGADLLESLIQDMQDDPRS